MKYAMKIIAFSPQKGYFHYLYYRGIGRYTMKLSEATIYDDVDVIEEVVNDKGMETTEYEVVLVSEKELFEARLRHD